jgi:hypothetical protein
MWLIACFKPYHQPGVQSRSVAVPAAVALDEGMTRSPRYGILPFHLEPYSSDRESLRRGSPSLTNVHSNACVMHVPLRPWSLSQLHPFMWHAGMQTSQSLQEDQRGATALWEEKTLAAVRAAGGSSFLEGRPPGSSCRCTTVVAPSACNGAHSLPQLVLPRVQHQDATCGSTTA